ncbi:ASKHA domain-containing protein [Celeribacter arenosi]|uniref:ASKHA domain-containing protein n=1 Tax=Celeribacter arenosi TaxID=792649 RepID=A0ABP7KFB6_9RHOB
MSDTDPLVIFTPSGKRGRVARGTPVLQAARQLGVDLDSVCGGRGICSKCQVQPSFGQHSKHGITAREDALSEFNAVEERYDRIRGLKIGRRLGCQACIEGDIVLDVPPESQVHKQVVRKAATTRAIDMDAATRLYYVEVEPADMHAPTGDWERCCTALAAQWGLSSPTLSTAMLSRVQSALMSGDYKITLAVNEAREGAPRIVGVWAGFAEPAVMGLAIDLGSTTIAAHLTDLVSGEVKASGGVMNPQIRFGEDLMSRVSYAMMNDGGAAEMTSAVREAINTLAAELALEAGLAITDIFEAVFVMNPVMHHLLMGFDPVPLGQAPFALATSSALDLPARDIGLTLAPEAQVYVLPLIAGHVGADAAAVALSEAPQKSEPLTLIVDVGTNAEILLGNKSGVLACSSPTGPAFEGAQISSGQRAAPGAIERVEINAETKEPRFKVIGCDLWSDDPEFADQVLATGVTGICGSGIIEAVAEMRMAGIVDAKGLVGSPDAVGTTRCRPTGRTFEYLLYDGSAEGGSVISVTQGDIRAIQLAKSALYAGARLLMDELDVDQVDRVVLAGAFGAHISPKHAMVLGMIPDCALEHVTSAGNAAGTGAQIALINRGSRREVEALVSQITKIETALAPRFQEHFVAANGIPHASDPFAGLRAVVPLPDPHFTSGDSASRGRRGRRR